MLEPEDINTLQEYLGYCLIPSTKAQAAMFIVGSGGEGKSRIGVVTKEIFGNAWLSGDFQNVEKNKFFVYNMQNKLIMVDDDMQMKALSSTGNIKTLITAEAPISIEAKGKQAEQAILYTRFLCFSNDSPKALYDKSDGFTRRLIILKTKPIPQGRVNDPNLVDKFIAEKDKIFIWMFDGLKRLINQNFVFLFRIRQGRILRSLNQNPATYLISLMTKAMLLLKRILPQALNSCMLFTHTGATQTLLLN